MARAQFAAAREPAARDPYPAEIRAYTTLDEQNSARLRSLALVTGSMAPSYQL